MADDQPLISASKGSAGDAVLSRRFRRCTKAMIAHGGRQCDVGRSCGCVYEVRQMWESDG